MNDICRLCLCVMPDKVYSLCENTEIMLKINYCLQLEITNDMTLPNHICHNCNDKIDQSHTFLKMVSENQNILKHHLKMGIECLNSFYLSLKDVKEENNVELKEEDKEVTVQDFKEEELIEAKEDLNETEMVLKKEYDETCFEDTHYSSDDNITLKSLKDISKNIDKQRKVTKRKYKQCNPPIDTDPNLTETKENINSKEYKCLTCFKVFKARSKLKEHYENEHKPTNLSTYDKNDYTEVAVDGQTKFKCGKCDKIYRKKRLVRSHMQYKHKEIRPYICNLCGRTYKTIQEIIQHSRAHNGVKLFCSYKCGYNTSYMVGLRYHENKHRNEHKYKCEKCGKGFDVKTWYDDHQNIHTGAKPFVCKTCGVAYPFRRYLVRHETTAHPANAPPPCDKTRFICTHCSLPCPTKFVLMKHLSMEHGIKQCFLCDVCGKSYGRASNLLYHKKIHLGIKSHTCSTCNKSFMTSSHLKRHELQSHAGYRRHGCAQCSKRYVEKSALLKHMLRHHSGPVQKTTES